MILQFVAVKSLAGMRECGRLLLLRSRKNEKDKVVFWVILPWCGFISMLGYEGIKLWERHMFVVGFRKSLPDIASMTPDIRMLGEYGIFKVVASKHYTYDGVSENLAITAYDKYLVTLSKNSNRKGDLHISVYRSMMPVEPLLDCGTLPSAVFPSFIVVYPQTGPDAGRYWYGDYDLDGKFEKKAKRIAG